jgi:hypothetical protein
MVPTLKKEMTRDVHVESVSRSVSFQYYSEDGTRLSEGLVASDRWYPAIKGVDRFLFGLRRGNRFIPGVLWCDTFIPGLVTSRAFVPGIVVGGEFMPGMVASGVLMPGIVQGSCFVPGIVERRHFVPGAFTTADRKFVPGLIENGGFSAGVWDKGSFVPVAPERIPAREIRAMPEQGYGLAAVRRFERLGGVPVAGAVLATYGDTGMLLYHGLLTDSFALLGGLRPGEDLAVMEPRQQLDEALKEMGIDTSDPNDPTNALHGASAVQKRIDQMIKDLQSGLFGTGIGAWQSGGPASPVGELASALDGMGQGASDMMDRLNQGWSDYWAGLLGAGQGGVSSGSSSSGKKTGAPRSWVVDGGRELGGDTGAKIADGAYEIATDGAAGASIGSVFGPVGAVIGGIVGVVVGIVRVVTGSSDDQQKPDDQKPKPGAGSEPGEDGGDGADDVVIGGGSHPKPLMPYIIHRTQLIQVNLGEYDLGATGAISTQEPVIKVVVTDTGAVAIFNFAAFKKYAMSHGRTGGTLVVNVLTGETETWYLGNAAVVVGEDVPVPYWIRSVGHPQY